MVENKFSALVHAESDVDVDRGNKRKQIEESVILFNRLHVEKSMNGAQFRIEAGGLNHSPMAFHNICLSHQFVFVEKCEIRTRALIACVTVCVFSSMSWLLENICFPIHAGECAPSLTILSTVFVVYSQNMNFLRHICSHVVIFYSITNRLKHSNPN